MTDDTQRLDEIRQSIIRQFGNDPHQDRVILRRTDWDLVLESLALTVKADDLRHKLWMVACHATGGGIPEIEGIDRSTNDICVQITAFRNKMYQAGKDAAADEMKKQAGEVAKALAKAVIDVEFQNSHAAYEDDVAAVITSHLAPATAAETVPVTNRTDGASYASGQAIAIKACGPESRPNQAGEVERLRKALEPFVAIPLDGDNTPDGYPDPRLWRTHLVDARAALAGQPTSSQAGFGIVSREPTQEQLIAGNEMFHAGEVPLNIYRAMIDALKLAQPSIGAKAAFKNFFEEQRANVEWDWNGEGNKVLVDAVFDLDKLLATLAAAPVNLEQQWLEMAAQLRPGAIFNTARGNADITVEQAKKFCETVADLLPKTDQREAIARLIDPLAWGNVDEDRKNYPADPPQRFLESLPVQSSLAKANAILALRS